MHFVSQFAHVSRHFGVYTYSRKQEKYLGKTVLRMWSQIKRKISYVSTKLLFEKSAKTKNKYKQKTMKTFRIFGGFWGQN